MDNNQNTDTSSSALGEISVLTPSQKRALEKAEEEKRQKEAAIQERRRQNAAKKKAREERARKLQLAESIVAPAILMVCGTGLAVVGFSCDSPELGAYGLILDVPAIIWGAIVISRNK